jgi:translation initiation factor 2 subunit 3
MSKASGPVQPVINIGTIGHVDHGKTTLVQALSGKWTDTHSEEVKRGITIRLGYADSVFRKCPKCEGIEGFTIEETCKKHKVKTDILRKVSFVDSPGHESLMATMLSGATIIDGALLLVAANEHCPQPQTIEHLMALQISGIKNLVVVQNKIDVVSETQALENFNQIKALLKGTGYEDAPIIPISAQHRVNIDALIQAIEDYIPTPDRDPNSDLRMLVARSFDINKPGSDPLKISGGVLGGAIIQGKLKKGQEVEIKPGIKIEKEGKTFFEPLFTKITSIITGGVSVDEAVPGGSIGVQTTLDPSIVKSDQLTGAIVGTKGKLPPIWSKFKIDVHLLERVVGAKEELKVEPIKKTEPLMLNVNSAATVGVVTELSKNIVECVLKRPVCADVGARVTISRRIANRFRLIGYGIIKG